MAIISHDFHQLDCELLMMIITAKDHLKVCLQLIEDADSIEKHCILGTCNDILIESLVFPDSDRMSYDGDAPLAK